MSRSCAAPLSRGELRGIGLGDTVKPTDERKELMLNDSERLRTILFSLDEVMPEVSLKDALKHVESIEAKLKIADLPTYKDGDSVALPDFAPKTIAHWIDSQSVIKYLIADSMKFNAIKETRALTSAGIKEAKEGVEAWERGEHL